jgi:uncharacterized protein YajQ (UPF0234 family)
MPSLDVVSELNLQEVENAINQAKKEITNRYDFRGSKSEFAWDKKIVTITADDEYKMGAMKDVLQGKMHHRGVDIRSLKFSEVEPAGGMLLKQKVEFVQGIEKEKAKDIIKAIKDSKLKVQAQIQDEKVRVTSKSIDELQETIKLLKMGSFGIPLQFTNMRS